MTFWVTKSLFSYLSHFLVTLWVTLSHFSSVDGGKVLQWLLGDLPDPGVGVESGGRDGEGAEVDEGGDPAVEGGGVVAGLEVGKQLWLVGAN